MMLYLISHDRDLLAHFFGGGIVAAGRFIEQNRKRRFQRVREIADMRARAIDDFAVRIQQRVDFARERRDFVGKFPSSLSARPERIADKRA